MKQVACLLGALALSAAAAGAAESASPPAADPRGTLSLAVENDLFGGSDRFYTNGLQLSWRSASASLPAPLAWLDRRLDFLQGPGALRWGAALGHSIFTPRNTQARVPDPRDRPYAGLLLGSVSLHRVTADSLSTLEFQAGLVGPSAGGEFVQNNWHVLIGAPRARGWDAQLRDEFVAAGLLDRKRRVRLGTRGGIEGEFLPSATVSIGSLQTYGALGGLLRVGQGLDADFGPARIRPALAGSAFFQPPPGARELGWYVFGGAEGRLVANDILLDGNSADRSRGVDRRPAVADFQVGGAVIWRGARVGYTQVWRTEEFHGQRGGMQQFGSVNVSFRF